MRVVHLKSETSQLELGDLRRKPSVGQAYHQAIEAGDNTRIF
jgi:hypothetical protein